MEAPGPKVTLTTPWRNCGMNKIRLHMNRLLFPFLLILIPGLARAQADNVWRQTLADEARQILDYWSTHAVDREGEGFHGRVDIDNQVHPEAVRSAVLNTRLLWTYSAAGLYFEDASYRPLADRAYHYLIEHFVDPDHGGVYWSVHPDGSPADASKQVYAQSFALYAFAEYYRWTGEERAREEAIRIFRLLRKHAYDEQMGGYFEAFEPDWSASSHRMLTGGHDEAEKTMNTHLHVMEAFSNLYRIWPEAEMRTALEDMVSWFEERIYDPATGHLILFFKPDWTPVGQYFSFGHDIEASWLLLEAAELLGGDWPDRVEPMALRLAQTSYQEGLDADGALLYEAEPEGLTRTEKSWWPQAEAMVGFYNAFQLTGEDRFREASFRVWTFIDEHIADRENGEWFSQLDRELRLQGGNDKVNAWKGPYHNTRACLEMHRRLGGSH
jgi:mannobiose 2-epimerase